MENAVEALKIAFAVLLFVMALSLSMSCFSQATEAVGAVTTLRDTHMHYQSIVPSNGLTRIVGIETIIPTLYTAYTENIEIYFQKADGSPMPIYYEINSYGKRVKDEMGQDVIVNYLNLSKEKFGNEANKSAQQVAKEHLDMILAVGINNKVNYNNEAMVEKYKNQFYYSKGFYEELEGKKFEEILGEYYQGEKEGTAIKKRVITYKLVP